MCRDGALGAEVTRTLRAIEEPRCWVEGGAGAPSETPAAGAPAGLGRLGAKRAERFRITLGQGSQGLGKYGISLSFLNQAAAPAKSPGGRPGSARPVRA